MSLRSPYRQSMLEVVGRTALEVLGRTAIIHGVAVANYIHLQQVQKVQNTSRIARLLRYVLFAFLPTIVVAEFVLNAFRTLFLFAQMDPSRLTLDEVVRNWKRYFSGLAGIRIVPTPVQEDDIENPATGLLDNEVPPSAATIPGRSLRLSKIRDSGDLQQHRQPWTWQVVIHIAVLVLPILQGIGTIVLYSRRHGKLEIDRRNLMAGISSMVCSLSSVAILLCRSQWSLQHLNSQERDGDYVVRTFFLEIFLASLLSEGPFMELGIMPISWVEQITDVLHLPGIIFVTCFGIVVWFAVWAFDDRIKQKITVNWNFVLGVPMLIITVWTLADLIAYLIVDILELTGSRWRYGVWDQDSLSRFLPIC